MQLTKYLLFNNLMTFFLNISSYNCAICLEKVFTYIAAKDFDIIRQFYMEAFEVTKNEQVQVRRYVRAKQELPPNCQIQ